jgi:heat-inducible transcriptional repressor
MSIRPEFPELNPREKEVLGYIIQNFITTATPVASQSLVQRNRLNVSSATVRSAMNTLEAKGLLNHPHTSAGRVPTDLGYRFYVDTLMRQAFLTREEEEALDRLALTVKNDMDEGVRSAARILARLSNLLAVVISPRYAQGIFRKMELISLSSNRLMVVLTIDSGYVRTVSVEVESEISRKHLDYISSILNERLSGIVISEIAANIGEIVADIRDEDESGLIRVFVDSADTIFDETDVKRFHFGGVEYIALQPEFNDLSQYKSIIELIENEHLIVHLLENETKDQEISIRIGSENELRHIGQCSVVSASYNIGNIKGAVGLVGPTRMNYPRMVALVDQISQRLSRGESFRTLR